jgi:transposase-like protein
MSSKKPSNVQAFSVREFFARFPDDASCLKHIMEVRYGLRHDCQACGVVDATFHKLAKRPAYSCAHCGHHVYPCAGTIFQDSKTPLQVWFYAIYLFVTTRHGVSGKELQRTLGVTYKTAWRIGQQIRDLMGKADGFVMLQGHVELDEAYVGGKRGRGAPGKTIVMGRKERGGRMETVVIPNVKTDTLKAVVTDVVRQGSTISTDELVSYGLLKGDGFKHGQVKHGEKDYAHYDYRLGDTVSTNNVESFWKLFKASVRGTHIHISATHMQRYLEEFTFRSNHREMVNGMYDLLIGAI